MTNMSGVIQQLKKERVRLEDQLHGITAALTAFGKVYMHGTGTKAVGGSKKGTMSAAGRRKISRAQKARWKKAKTARPKRTISAAGRKRIAAAQRARWAKVKRERKVKRESKRA
jgi:glutamate-1-semialdehyde aminotransferase